MKKVATCFGGAMDVVDTLPYKDSIEIGKWLALNEYSVKTGGYKGIMEAFSKGAYESGGHVIGCTCDSFGVKAIPNQYITEERRSKDLFERLANLIEEEDVYRIFIFQIGGAGTLAELFICLDLFRKMKQAPPIYLVGEHYQEIIDVIKPYMNEQECSLFRIVEDKEELYKYIEIDENYHLDSQGE